MIDRKFKYPYEILNYEWKRLFPWAVEAFSVLDDIFSLSAAEEYEVYFDEFGIHVNQRGKNSKISFDSTVLPMIRERYQKACFEVDPYIPETVSATINIICRHFEKRGTEYPKELKAIWLAGDKQFVVDFLRFLVNENVTNQSEKRCKLMNHLLDLVEI